MKKTLIIFLILLFCIYTWGKFTGNLLYFGKTTLANQSISSVIIFGGLSTTKMKIDKVNVYGFAEIDLTEIGKSISVRGPLQISGSQIEGYIEAEGPVEINDSVIQGVTNIIGDLDAENTAFNNDINITSRKIKLSRVAIEGNLIIHGRKTEQVLELNHGTIIKGSVIFKSGMGRLVQDEDSKIEGNIEGLAFKSA